MVEPVDERGLTPLTRVRPIKRDDSQRRSPKPPPEEEAGEPPEAGKPSRGSRLGRNIDEHC